MAAVLVAGASVFSATKEKFFAYRSFWPETAAMRQFAEAGVNLYAVMPSNSFNTLGEPYCKFPPFWVWDETYLWDIVDRQFDLVIEQNPNAKFICMIDINSPLWLSRRLNRKYGMGGDSYQEISNSLCIKEWRELTEKMVAAYVKHMEEKYGDRVESYIVAGGGTSEWYCCSQGRFVPQKEEVWKKWLKEKGLPDWEIPTHKKINSPTFEKKYFDPQTQKPVIEYARFTEELISQGVEDFSVLVRKIVGDKRQIGAFCGFIPMQFSGKLDNSRTFASATIDFIGSPGGYDNRKIGFGGGMNSPSKSLSLTGKHWFQEIDHRTHTYNGKLTPYVEIGGIHADGAKNQAETDAILKREFALAAVMQNSLWCFDMWGGIFNTSETMALVKKAKQIWDEHKNDNLEYRAEIAYIIDPDSGSYSKYSAVTHLKRILYASGTTFDTIFFKDIANVDFSKYKVAVFPNSFEITPEKKELLEKYVFKNNRTVITAEAFGATDGKKIDKNFTRELTGFDFKTKGLNQKQMNGWKSVYADELWRINNKNFAKIAKEAGVHMYLDEQVPVYANDKLVGVHVKDGGKKEIRLPRKAKKIVELFTGKIVGENTDKFTYDFKSPDTALFELRD